MICQALANTLKAKANNFADIMLAMKFSDWLFTQINAKGWSQAELAARAGVTRTAISDVLSQRRNPGHELCNAIARALNLPPETVFRAAGLLPPVPPDTGYDEQILHLLHQLPPEEQKRYLELLQFEVERQKSKKPETKSREKPPARMLLIDK